MDVKAHGAILTFSPDYKPGDPAPSGYLDWHDWAEVQHKAGLRQVECHRCGKWRFPQELSGLIETFKAKDRMGRAHTINGAVCIKCVSKEQP